MQNSYQVYMNRTVVGEAVVEECGLYLKFSCRCRLKQEGLYRLTVQVDNSMKDLGTLLRDDSGYYLTTNVPRNKFNTGNFLFEVGDRAKKASGEFIPLAAEKPFLYITKLKQSYMEIRDGEIGVVVPK